MNSDFNTGRSDPLGATPFAGGVNFSVYSRSADRIELLLFDDENDSRPQRVIPLNATTNRTYHYWHVFVRGIAPGQLYGYRADGPFDPWQGNRFDASKVLLDPYAKAVAVPQKYSREAAKNRGDNTATAMGASSSIRQITIGKGMHRCDIRAREPLSMKCTSADLRDIRVQD